MGTWRASCMAGQTSCLVRRNELGKRFQVRRQEPGTVSKTSSDPALSGAEPLEKIPFLGTTWHRRGAAYWLRRVSLCTAWLLMTAIGGSLTYQMWHACAPSLKNTAPRVCVATGIWLLICGGMVNGWRNGRRGLARVVPPSEARARQSDARRRNMSLGLGLRSPMALLVPISLPFGTGALFGFTCAVAFSREFLHEKSARLDYERCGCEEELRREVGDARVPTNRQARRHPRRA